MYIDKQQCTMAGLTQGVNSLVVFRCCRYYISASLMSLAYNNSLFYEF